MIILGICSWKRYQRIRQGLIEADQDVIECVPGGTANWYVKGPAGTRFTLRLERVPGSGGHVQSGHRGTGPVGTLSAYSGTIPSQGSFKIVLKAPEVSGEIRTIARIGAIEDSGLTRVRIQGLQELPDIPEIERVGFMSPHPKAHYGHPALIAALVRVAKKFHAKFKKPLPVNDISLPWGGLFDIDYNWKPDHKFHRDGKTVDVRSKTMSPDQKRFFEKIAKDEKFSVLLEKKRPHFHLTLTAKRALLLDWERRRK